jgi:hypothetical protein
VKSVEEPLRRLADEAGWALADIHRRGPAEALGGRFEINGSIWLSDLLDTGISGERPQDLDTVLEQTLGFRERLAARIRAIRNQIVRRYENPFGGAERLPNATELLRTLEACGARPKTNRKAAERAARAISGAHRQRFARALKTARAELVFLRDDLTPEIQRLGPEATEIERIDAALSRALLVGTRTLTERLTERLEACFEEAFVCAATSLPDGPSDDDEVVPAVEAWNAEGGFIRAHVRDTEALALALYDRDAELLTQLVDAAYEIASRGIQ